MPSAADADRPRALVVEDQTTFRDLLAELLDTRGLGPVVATTTGKEALAQVARHSFKLVLLDLVLPDMHGFDVLAALDALPRTPRILVLTSHARPNVVREAMAHGAHAVVTKSAPLRELREAIERVSAGGIYYCSETSRLLREAATSPQRHERLTPRQREILRAVAQGLSSREIAQQLALSEKTVANHRARIMERLGVNDVAGLTRAAVALGLVDPEP